ncbi:MAG TPA: hemerythrin domain-containing protein [Anaeromyxobacter sp.]
MARARQTARRTVGRRNGSTHGAGRGASGSGKLASTARAGGRRAPAERARGARASRSGTDAAQVLKRQHDEALELFRILAGASGDERRSTFLRLADVLAAHATIEERLLYSELTRHDETGDLARDAVEEHLAMKRLLADMLEEQLSDEVFDAKRRVLEDEVRRHVEEEERRLLPRAAKLVGRERMAELGAELERTFGELMQHEPRRNLPREAEGTPVLH